MRYEFCCSDAYVDAGSGMLACAKKHTVALSGDGGRQCATRSGVTHGAPQGVGGCGGADFITREVIHQRTEELDEATHTHTNEVAPATNAQRSIWHRTKLWRGHAPGGRRCVFHTLAVCCVGRSLTLLSIAWCRSTAPPNTRAPRRRRRRRCVSLASCLPPRLCRLVSCHHMG